LIAAYLDESFDMAKAGLFVVGGLMGRGVAVFELERRWEGLRKRRDIDIAFYKASDCEAGKGEFAKFVRDPKNITPEERHRLDAISREFLALIPREGLPMIAFGVGIVQKDFYDIIREPNARAILGRDPYRLAYDFAMIQCAWAMSHLSTGDNVAFVCDEHEKYGPVAPEAYRALKLNNPIAEKYLGSFSVSDDRRCEPLQAADAVVFEIRRALKLSLKEAQGTLRRQFSILSDNRKMFAIQYAHRENLLRIVATHKPGEPFKLDEIMDQHFEEDIHNIV
jgi:hypothetical protein